jgi:hypothetical protein
VAAFTLKDEMNTYLRRRLDTFANPLFYAFAAGYHDHGEGAR